jgi:RNA polymerase sigma factor (sigma-70 family)
MSAYNDRPFSSHRNYKHRQYEEVGRNQVYLTEEEEIEKVEQYTLARDELRSYILSKRQCRQWYIDLYKTTKTAGRSVAKLNSKFNPRVKGLSTKLEAEMASLFKCLGKDNHGAHGASHYAASLFIHRMNPSEYCYTEMEKLMPRTKILAKLQARVSKLEDTLLRSMLMAAHEIANRSSSNILSIDENDAVQEAQVFFLESIRKYDPDYRTPEGNRVKLCTYAYSRAERLVQEWILTNSRLVRVPRSKMGRILTVVKAYETLADDDINLYKLTSEANKIQRSKCVLTDTNTFTTKEVDELIKILMSNYIHLDQPFNRHNKSNPTTIGEMISNDEPCVTDLIQAQDKKEQLLEILQDNLEEIEFQIISLRYFHDPADKVPKALKEIGPLLVSVYGGTGYSRESIRKIEKIALAKMKDLWEIKRLW